MNVVLFDIDGTLIRSGGAGKAAMEQALQTEFGVREIIDRVAFSGRTDPAISLDLLRLHGLEPSAANVERLKIAYLRLLPAALERNSGIVLPGVRALLDRLQLSDRVAVGLLTGNVREGARRKLIHFQLWDDFAFGAFADGIHDRDDIARRALLEIARQLGRDVPPSHIWVIGDTPHDVQCALAIGAQAVAVATGWHSIEELRETRADYVLQDLVRPAELMKAWGF
jgi:phosphoglycolate phosphatase-like HAD superfamily hydrolase